MSYDSSTEPDGSKLSPGTLRVHYDDDRNCWGVTLQGDSNYGTALVTWEDGEFWDGASWRPLSEYNEWLDARHKPTNLHQIAN